MGRKRRSSSIELCRFLFSLAVVLFHAQDSFLSHVVDPYVARFTLFAHGNCAVEFFFLVSGYLMAASVGRKAEPTSGEELARDTQSFVLGKARSVWPYHVPLFVTSLITAALVMGLGVAGTAEYALRSIPSFFFLQMLGFKGGNPNSVEWYISAMLIVMAVLYPMLRRHYHMFKKVVAPLLSLAVLGWLFRESGQLTGVSAWCGITYRSVLRALAEIALGIWLHDIVQHLDQLQLSRGQQRLLSFVQAASIVAVLAGFCTTMNTQAEFLFLLLLAVGVALSFSRHSLLNDLLDRKAILWLGAFSTPLYLSQVTGLNLTKLVGGGILPVGQVALAVGLTFAIALAFHALVRARARTRRA